MLLFIYILKKAYHLLKYDTCEQSLALHEIHSIMNKVPQYHHTVSSLPKSYVTNTKSENQGIAYLFSILVSYCTDRDNITNLKWSEIKSHTMWRNRFSKEKENQKEVFFICFLKQEGKKLIAVSNFKLYSKYFYLSPKQYFLFHQVLLNKTENTEKLSGHYTVL